MLKSLCLVLGVIALVTAVDPPTQIHIAYAGAVAGTGMAVSWVTQNATYSSLVYYGLSASSLTFNASGTQDTYYQTWDHNVVLTNLKPNTVYYYKCGDASAGFSTIYKFTTAPSVGQEFPLKLAIFGDMGIWNSNATFGDLARVAPGINFIYHVGDISYADDDYLHNPLVDHYEYTWNTFMTDMAPYASTLPYMVLPGNHEAECHSPICFLDSQKREAFQNFTAYNHRFRMPSPESSGTMNMWYSFDYGSVHFIQIDTETDYPGAPNDDYSSHNGNFGNQLAWLEADLAKVAAKRAAGQLTWLIVSGHRPVYSRAECDANGNPNGTAQATQAAFEALFMKYKVDVYFCGHVHSVEASYPVYNNTVVKSFSSPPFPVYVVTGAAGCDEGHSSYAGTPVTQWTRYSNDQDFGLSTLTIADAHTLTWEFRRATDGTVLDTFTITK